MSEPDKPSVVVSNYASPKAHVGSNFDTELKVWKPLVFLVFCSMVTGVLYSEPVKPLISRNGASLLHAILLIATISGLIWWAKCDSYRYNYKLTKVKVWLLVLLGPTGILIYSFFTRGFIGGVLLALKMGLFVFILILAMGISGVAVDWVVQYELL